MEHTYLSAPTNNGILLENSGGSSCAQGKRACQVIDKPKEGLTSPYSELYIRRWEWTCVTLAGRKQNFSSTTWREVRATCEHFPQVLDKTKYFITATAWKMSRYNWLTLAHSGQSYAVVAYWSTQACIFPNLEVFSQICNTMNHLSRHLWTVMHRCAPLMSLGVSAVFPVKPGLHHFFTSAYSWTCITLLFAIYSF